MQWCSGRSLEARGRHSSSVHSNRYRLMQLDGRSHAQCIWRRCDQGLHPIGFSAAAGTPLVQPCTEELSIVQNRAQRPCRGRQSRSPAPPPTLASRTTRATSCTRHSKRCRLPAQPRCRRPCAPPRAALQGSWARSDTALRGAPVGQPADAAGHAREVGAPCAGGGTHGAGHADGAQPPRAWGGAGRSILYSVHCLTPTPVCLLHPRSRHRCGLLVLI